MSEINVVPYIDVMLVLLVIFMVTAPLLAEGVKVDLPQTTSKPLEKLKQRHPRLKLYAIHTHDTPLLGRTQDSVRPSVAHLVSLAEDSC